METLNIDFSLFNLAGVAINVLIGFIAYRMRLVDKSGLATGIVLGAAVFLVFKWQGFLILLTFFALGSAATKFRTREKAKLGIAQRKGGKRGAKHVIANGGVAFILACGLAVSTDYDLVFQHYFAAFTASLATALADTLSTELGQVYGKKCYLLITMERVKVGTEGAVSLEGSLWGMAGASLLATMAAALGMFPFFPVKTAVLVFFAAVIANLIESIIGGVFNQFERSANEFMLNLTNTIVGAALCFFFVH